jgi:NADPH-dependent 2,4-dienoyl-CoA reductase/sulfur reductase-like enzyme
MIVPTTTNGNGKMEDEIVKTDLVIIGAGPAGAALACFLASHGEFPLP